MKAATPQQTCTYSKTYVEQSLEEVRRIISGWPSWKVASMSDGESVQTREMREELLAAGE